MKRRQILIFSILIATFSCMTVHAEWTKKARRSFNKATEYHVIFDNKDTNYDDMDSIAFVEYNAAKNNMSVEQFSVILKYMSSEICKALSKKNNKTYSLSSVSPYTIYLHLDKLTSKAGMTVSVYTYVDSLENGVSFKLEVADGRWNRFDRLLQENCNKLSKKIVNFDWELFELEAEDNI